MTKVNTLEGAVGIEVSRSYDGIVNKLKLMKLN